LSFICQTGSTMQTTWYCTKWGVCSCPYEIILKCALFLQKRSMHHISIWIWINFHPPAETYLLISTADRELYKVINNPDYVWESRCNDHWSSQTGKWTSLNWWETRISPIPDESHNIIDSAISAETRTRHIRDWNIN
jgi:hypothetical protein